jgi:hypothetical protein
MIPNLIKPSATCEGTPKMISKVSGKSAFRLQTEGRLPAEFAERAGWGDIVAAAGALALLPCQDGPGFRRALALWSWIGLIDLLGAVATAAYISVSHPGSMAELSTLPLTRVPRLLAPILLPTPLILFQPNRFANSFANGLPSDVRST